jgi:hypothetical protein
MRKAIIFIVLFTAGTALALDAVAAGQTAVEQLLDGDTTGRRVYVLPDYLESGAVEFWHTSLSVPAGGAHFVFIDDVPAANWEHPARAVFVDDAGRLTVYEVSTPPKDEVYGALSELTDPEKWAFLDPGNRYPDPEAIARTAARLEGLLPEPASRAGDNYALLMSGGASQYSNYTRYWNDMSYIYTTLIEVYGYDENNIIVLMSDGDNPAGDQSDGSSSDLDLDQDGDDDYSLACTRTNIFNQMDWLASNLTADDALFIFTTDHGGSDGAPDSYLNLWSYQELADDEFADELDDIAFAQCIVTMEQCFSGGFVDDVDGIANVVISTACADDEYSWAMGPDYKYDEYVYYWTAAVAGNEPGANPWELDGDAVDADDNGNGVVSAEEAFLYAEAHDTASETPQYNDYSDIGDLISLWGAIDGAYLRLSSYETVGDHDGNSMLIPGEHAEINLSLFNLGGDDATNTTATLTSNDPEVVVDVDTINFGTVGSGDTEDSPYPFEITIDTGCPEPSVFYLDLHVEEDGGYAEDWSIPVGVSSVWGFADYMEDGDGKWTHTGDGDMWHLESYNNYDGVYSWKCGGYGNGDYQNDMDCTLESLLVLVGIDSPELSLYTSYKTQSNYDGCELLFGGDGREWTLIDDYSGFKYGWELHTYDFADFAGLVGQLRFRFYSDSSSVREGFYFDNIELTPQGDTPAELTTLDAASSEEGILLSWSVDNPGQYASYNVYRQDGELVEGWVLSRGDRNPTTPLNETPLDGGDRYYRFLDRDVDNGASYLYYVQLTEVDGHSTLVGPLEVDYASGDGIRIDRLAEPYPNPAAGRVTVEFELADDSPVNLAVYDLAGRRVAQPVEGELPAGRHTVTWDSTATPSGVYLIRLQTNDATLTRRVIVER